MFRKGDLVLHRCYGAGVVVNIRKVSMTENEQAYYTVDLTTGERLLIPVNQAEQLGLSAMVHSEAILKVLSDAPQLLADDYRLRKTEIDRKMSSGDPLRIAEVLRDLTWREHDAKLSTGDAGLRGDALKFLSGLLAAHSGTDTQSASGCLSAALKQSILARRMSV